MRVRSRASYRKRMQEKGRSVRERRDVPVGQRYCPDCSTTKPLEDFSRNPSARSGHHNYCKPCHYSRTQASVNKHHGSTRSYHLKRRYGLTEADVASLIDDQGGLCLLCRERKPEHVDHDHVTGAVRGVLCSCCNQGLGNFRDNVAFVRAAADYLERTTWQRTQVCTGVYRLTSPRPAVRPSPSSSALQHLICSRRTASSPAQ